MRRAINQDAMAVLLADSKSTWERIGHLFIVADGMGAHAAGELASKLAVELIPHQYLKIHDLSPAESLHKSISEANAEIFRRGQANIEFRSMGTTCSLLSLLPEGAVAAHVGDSRVYQLRGNRLFQLTFDHSLVWEMQAAGEVTAETARSGVIPKNVITRSLGPNANVQIDLEGPFPVKVGDQFLLCSDGLSGQISDEEIGVIMRTQEPENAVRLMVDLSNLRGGPDNITAIVLKVTDDRVATTAPAGAIAVRRGTAKKPFSVALGVVTAVCFCAALILFLLGYTPLGIVASVLGVVALVTGLAQVYWIDDSSFDHSRRYGNGPYREYRAEPEREFFEHLAGTMKSLREVAQERNWKINWTQLDQDFATACKHADASRFGEAISLQGKVIINLMAQIRKQGDDSDPSDSSIAL
ncbi:MAG: serine/threonine-protein phosphatase [Planctomycetales bacterium]|nr:serine/threonine-protein phosphatase [Planctomycetales bacterium]